MYILNNKTLGPKESEGGNMVSWEGVPETQDTATEEVSSIVATT